MKISFRTCCKLWVPVCLVDKRSPRAWMEGVTHQAWQVSILEPCKAPSSAFLPEDGPRQGQPPAQVSRGSSAERADKQSNCDG